VCVLDRVLHGILMQAKQSSSAGAKQHPSSLDQFSSSLATCGCLDECFVRRRGAAVPPSGYDTASPRPPLGGLTSQVKRE